MAPFSSLSHALHWAHLLDAGAPLDVRSGRAYIACDDETRALEVGELSARDLRIRCAGLLDRCRRDLTPMHCAALAARFGRGQARVAGITQCLDAVASWAGPGARDLPACAMSLYRDAPSDAAGARLLAGVRAALVAHALAMLDGSI